MPTFWLSFHAAYACRHSGACCSSGWDIPIERSRIAPIDQAIANGRITATARWVRSVNGAPDEIGGVLRVAERGRRCVFHQAPGCAVQATLGHAAMPSACQHFPRIALIDRRGVFVTLSHYCPTAARLLFDATERATIVEGPPVLPDAQPPEGLDAREALPPSESPHRLMDLKSYTAWERHAVSVLTTGDAPGRAIDALDPGGREVSDERLLAIAGAAVPTPYAWRPQWPMPAIPAPFAPVVGRYLAAHAFASWTAYQGNGLRATVPLSAHGPGGAAERARPRPGPARRHPPIGFAAAASRRSAGACDGALAVGAVIRNQESGTRKQEAGTRDQKPGVEGQGSRGGCAEETSWGRQVSGFRGLRGFLAFEDRSRVDDLEAEPLEGAL